MAKSDTTRQSRLIYKKRKYSIDHENRIHRPWHPRQSHCQKASVSRCGSDRLESNSREGYGPGCTKIAESPEALISDIPVVFLSLFDSYMPSNLSWQESMAS